MKRVALLAGLMTALPVVLPAQNPTLVEALAPLLMAEDRRAFDPMLFSRAIHDADSSVRAYAALSIGRIGDPRGTPLLVQLLADRDRTVLINTMFALGLMRDTGSVQAIVARLKAADSLPTDALAEAGTALARIGGDAAAHAIEGVLSGGSDIPVSRADAMIPGALLDAWKLGPRMPAPAMMHFVNDTSVDYRWRSIYALGRARAPVAGPAILRALRDPTPLIRETAARALTRAMADTAGMARPGVRSALVRALDDEQPGVRTNALGSLATFEDSTDAPRVIPLLADPDPNVRVAAATTLGSLKGSAAARALDAVMDRRDAFWALKRTALTSLSRVDTNIFARRAAAAIASNDFRDRIAALQGWSATGTRDASRFRAGLSDPDVRVQAAALESWSATRGDTAMLGAARSALRSADPGMRAAGASALRAGATAGDIEGLLVAWRRSAADRDADARIAILSTLRALSRRQPDLLTQLDQPARRDFLQRPSDPLVRADAARTWPELAARWGDKWPVETGRSLDDYRGVVRTYLLTGDDPEVTIEVDNRGPVTIKLLGHEAPLTVANFLRLVDRHYFDGNRWHRVVPNFVVQDGDPTGTGNGGPGWAIRDEINRERYTIPMMGMALSGPDTGGSQWFINLSPQPHLDGVYTIFGKVTGSYTSLSRIVQGDVIRSIHR